MKGYLSFILVFLSVLLLFSILSIRVEAESVDLLKAISVTRTHSIQMNIKETVIESARQGAELGFSNYDGSHDVGYCKHCTDQFCMLRTPTNPNPPNFCDLVLCDQCFRESDVRSSAINSAVSQIHLLQSHQFDPDFNSVIQDPEIEVFLKSDPLAKNGFSFDYIRFRKELVISVNSQKFGINSTGKVPAGLAVYVKRGLA